MNFQKSNCELENRLIQAGLIDIQTLDASILIDLKYSSTDNFLGIDAYGCLKKCYLQKSAAEKLAKASTILQKEFPEYRFLVYDGARPLSVQQIMWDSIKVAPRLKSTYVANPAKGSIHNYGVAVDLTIAESNGTPLDMGTEFDYFGAKAYPRLEMEQLEKGNLTRDHIINRMLLRRIMKEAGFTSITSEWWHFNAMSRKRAQERYSIIP